MYFLNEEMCVQEGSELFTSSKLVENLGADIR